MDTSTHLGAAHRDTKRHADGASCWVLQAMEAAGRHPTVAALQSRAAWHSQQAQEFLNNSVASMRQHELEAVCLHANARFVQMTLVAQAGLLAGQWRSYCTGHNAEVGRYIQIETDQGWNPEQFWCESPAGERAPYGGS